MARACRIRSQPCLPRDVKGRTKKIRRGRNAGSAPGRVYGAVLVIAALDRLARNVSFVSTLMNADVEFVACDFPSANKLTIHILAAVAEHDAK